MVIYKTLHCDKFCTYLVFTPLCHDKSRIFQVQGSETQVFSALFWHFGWLEIFREHQEKVLIGIGIEEKIVNEGLCGCNTFVFFVEKRSC